MTLENNSKAEKAKEKGIREKIIGAGIMGFGGGFLTAMGLSLAVGPNVEKAEIFQRGEKPSVMRMYKDGRDEIFVENVSGEYIRLDDYLPKIQDKADRQIEEAEIRKTVRWYEE